MLIMIRPPWSTFLSTTKGAYMSCNCGQILPTQEQVREHWQAGHFDYQQEPADDEEEHKDLLKKAAAMFAEGAIDEFKYIWKAMADYDETPAGKQADRLARQRAMRMWWISVCDELPEPGQNVLRIGTAFDLTGHIANFIDVGVLVNRDGSYRASLNVTHWMPMPLPPEEKNMETEEPAAPDRISRLWDLTEYAWGIIANAGGGDWSTQTGDWREAAVRWRDRYHELLGELPTPSSDLEEAEDETE